jgi:hypothetical protein
VYLKAVQLERQLTRHGAASVRCCVTLDEATLPVQAAAALKVTHFYLENPEVATIMLTNRTLDAAKTNRCVQVVQREVSRDDMTSLCEGCLFDSVTSPPAPQRAGVRAGAGAAVSTGRGRVSLAQGLCRFFERVSTMPDFELLPGKRAFSQRDFVFLLRSLRRAVEAQSPGVSLREAFDAGVSFDTLMSALRRNFNGVSAAVFERVVEELLSCTGVDEPQLCTAEQAALMTTVSMEALRRRVVLSPQPLATLKTALRDGHR